LNYSEKSQNKASENVDPLKNVAFEFSDEMESEKEERVNRFAQSTRTIQRDVSCTSVRSEQTIVANDLMDTSVISDFSE